MELRSCGCSPLMYQVCDTCQGVTDVKRYLGVDKVSEVDEIIRMYQERIRELEAQLNLLTNVKEQVLKC